MNHIDLLQIEGLAMRHGQRQLFEALDLALASGSCTLLTGENGAGKSTLLRIVAGLERPLQGWFSVEGAPARTWKRARRILQKNVMYLHQQPYMFDGSVEYNLKFALPRSSDPQLRESHVSRALDWIGMEAFRHVPARTLSGGERQRLALARGWLGRPRLMLLDEPTANLDHESRERTLVLLRRLRAEGMTLVIASHDPHHFSGLAGRTLHLADGSLQEVENRPDSGVQSAKVIPIRRDLA